MPQGLKELTKNKIERFIDQQKFNTEWLKHPWVNPLGRINKIYDGRRLDK